MSKRAEERALEAYPVKMVSGPIGFEELLKFDFNSLFRCIFTEGYEQAEKDTIERDDLALTWQDIRRIVKIADDLLDDPKARVAFQNHNEEYYYERVLEQYNNSRDEADSED